MPAEYSVLSCRRALEALRNGVPNRDAVGILGCNQPQAEGRFVELLSRAADTGDPPSSALGMLVSGDFGAGKSHLLTHLEHEALSRGFVCSRVAVSKETPLYDLSKVFKSAVENGRIPGRNGRLIEELAQAFRPDSRAYAAFFEWANKEAGRGLISQVFPASLMVHKRSNDPELNGEIEAFWAGDRIKVSRVKDGLRQIGQLQNYSFRAPGAAELPRQRLRFVTELVKGAGYKGWVVLLDELELVGAYTILQRGRSYAELTRWMGEVRSEFYPGLVSVGTVAADFATAVISPDGKKKDRDYVAPKLAAGRYKDVVDRVETGMRLLERESLPLTVPTEDDVRETLEKLRTIYGIAYAWEAPALQGETGGPEQLNRMRYKVRAAINEWDLLRFYPGSKPQLEEDEFSHDYEDNVDLERESKDDAD